MQVGVDKVNWEEVSGKDKLELHESELTRRMVGFGLMGCSM